VFRYATRTGEISSKALGRSRSWFEREALVISKIFDFRRLSGIFGARRTARAE